MSTPEPGWPAWADTPEKRERNRAVWAARAEAYRPRWCLRNLVITFRAWRLVIEVTVPVPWRS